MVVRIIKDARVERHPRLLWLVDEHDRRRKPTRKPTRARASLRAMVCVGFTL